MLNIEKYKDEILNNYRHMQFYESVKTVAENHGVYSVGNIIIALNWLCEEYKEPVLNDEEKSLLVSIFNNLDIDTVFKKNDSLLLEDEDGTTLVVLYLKDWFEDLENNTRYTLEELGITYGD